MSILSAQSIRRLCLLSKAPLITPFYERTVFMGMTFGLDSAGYDIRAAENRTLWPFFGCAKIDAIERFDIPPNLKMKICDKSTWARRFVFVQNTRAEPGWRGILRIELTNDSWWFRRIKIGMPIAEVEFHTLDEPTEQPYPDDGKYQDQGPHQNAIYQKV